MTRRGLRYLAERAWLTVAWRSGARHLINRLRYGAQAPRPGQRLTISPDMLTERYHTAQNHDKPIGHWQTGRVLAGDWDDCIRSFEKSLKYNSCRQHFLNGIPWEDTRAIPYGLQRIARRRCRSRR